MLMWYQVVYYDDWQVGSLRSSCLFVWFVISGSRTDGEDPNIQLCIRVFRVVFQGQCILGPRRGVCSTTHELCIFFALWWLWVCCPDWLFPLCYGEVLSCLCLPAQLSRLFVTTGGAHCGALGTVGSCCLPSVAAMCGACLQLLLAGLGQARVPSSCVVGRCWCLSFVITWNCPYLGRCIGRFTLTIR